MALIKKLKWAKALSTFIFLCACAVISISRPLSAHVLNETTAQVILRDGQVEVKIHTDLEHLISALQSNQAWLLGDIDAVIPENLDASQQEAFVANALKHKMNLTVNGKTIIFEAVTFDTATFDTDTSDKEIVFQARHSFMKVSELSISFHKILGAVHTSFVKPQYKLLNAGATAHMVF
jgi:hypothetical protein